MAAWADADPIQEPASNGLEAAQVWRCSVSAAPPVQTFLLKPTWPFSSWEIPISVYAKGS